MKKKVGIVTWYYSNNYGSQLQAYALSKALSNIGYDAVMISRSHHATIRMIIDMILFKSFISRTILLSFSSNKRDVFIKNYFKEHYLSYETNSFDKYDNIICGSDQIWAPNVFSPYYMLDFVPNKVNKISYAASIGLDYIPDNLTEQYKKYIGRINHISVRESKGHDLLKERCGIESTVVLDPTLLVKKEEWDKIKKEPTINSNYIFCYFLKKNHNYSRLVKEYADKNKYEIYGVSDNESDSSWMHLLSHKQVGPCEFIGLIDGAQTVITDSYHGTIFSLLYHKDFVLFERFNVDDIICQNSRIEQLRKYFCIDNNIVKTSTINEIEIVPVDYDMIEEALLYQRDNSIRFLKEALS